MKAAIVLAFVLSLGCVSAIPTIGSIAASSASAYAASSSLSSCSSSSSLSFYETDVCRAYGYDIREYLSVSVFEEIEKQFMQKKCELLSSYNVYPGDLGYILDTLSPDRLCYDIIMVGAGPAALSAIPTLLELGKTILVIDSGYLPPACADSLYYRKSLYESSYVNSYEAYVNGQIARKLYSYNVLGGASVVDSGVWNIGCRSLYDQLAEINEAFAWEKVCSLYQSLECYQSSRYSSSVSVSSSTSSSSSSSLFSSSSASSSSSVSSSTTTTTYCYSKSGTYNIFNSYDENYLSRTISSVFNELGYCNNDNPFDLKPGFSILPILGDCDRPYLFPHTVFKNIGSCSNLDLALGTKVNKILFNGCKATGVQVTTITGQCLEIHAKEQVILGTGPINTYQLLFQSGIGPQNLLSQFNITPTIPLPYFGQGLAYSPIYNGLIVKFPRGSLVNNCDSDIRNLAYAFGDYSLSASTQIEYYRAYLAVHKSSTANVALKFNAYSYSTSIRFQSALRSYYQYDSHTQELLTKCISEYDLLFISIQLLNPVSRGSICYKDCLDTPYIDLGFYNDEQDILCMLEAIEQARCIATTNAFSSLGAELMQLPLQNVNAEFFTSEFNRQSLLYNTIPSTYCAGGFPMGTTYENAVVDKALRVVGTENLRLFSSIVSPFPLSSDSLSFNLMVGHYGAKTLLDEYSGIFLDTIDISSIGISASSTSIQSGSSSYSSRDIDIESSSTSLNNFSGLGGSISECETSSTDIDINSTSSIISSGSSNVIGGIGSGISSSSTDIDINSSSSSLSSSSSKVIGGIGSGINSSMSSSEYSASEYEAGYSANNVSSSVASGLGGGISEYSSSSSSGYNAASEVSSSSSSFNGANGSFSSSEYQSEYEASQFQESSSSFSSGGGSVLC